MFHGELDGAQCENLSILSRQNAVQQTQCSLFPIHRRLPKLDVAGSSPVSRSIFSITWDSQQLPSLHFTQLSGENGVFELFCRFGAPGQGGLGIDVNRHADTMPALVGCDLGINPGVMAETGMGSAQHLKIRPAEPDSCRAGASCADTRRYPSTSAWTGSPKRIPMPWVSCLPAPSIPSSWLAVFGGMATVRVELSVFGVSMSPR